MTSKIGTLILSLVLTLLMVAGSYVMIEYMGKCPVLPDSVLSVAEAIGLNFENKRICLNFWNGTFLTEFRFLINILLVFVFLSIAQKILNVFKGSLPE